MHRVVILLAFGMLLGPASMLEADAAARSDDVAEDPRVADAINLLDRWIDAQREYDQVPGISVALVYGEEVLWTAGFGHADLEGKQSATPDTIYSICSISKLFTGIATMQLRDRGALRLEDPVGSVLPWFDLAEEPALEELVTVRSLLTHTSGLATDIGERPDTEPYLHYTSRDELLSLLPHEKLIYRPWEHYNYSNVGMALLGEIIAEVSGEPYTKYVERYILGPLGMSSTTPDIAEVWGSEKLATGYGPIRRNGGRARVGLFEGRAMLPAMGFASTVADLAKFAAWQLRLLENNSFEILGADTLREMQRVQYLDPTTETASGLAFAIYRQDGDTIVGHGGDCPGYRSDLSILPKERIAAVALANAVIPVWRFTGRALDIIAPRLAAVASDPSGGKKLSEDQRKYLGTYDGFPWSGEFQVVPWNGNLAVVRFPTENPLSVLRVLEHLGDGRFREIQQGGLRRMEYTFETDSSGEVVRMVTEGYPRPKVPDRFRGS